MSVFRIILMPPLPHERRLQAGRNVDAIGTRRQMMTRLQREHQFDLQIDTSQRPRCQHWLSFLKIRPPRLPFVGLIGYWPVYGQVALDRPWDTAIPGTHAPEVGTREPRASAATRRVEAAPAAAATDGHGPTVLGTVAAVAGDDGGLAPARVSMLLGVKESAKIRSARAVKADLGDLLQRMSYANPLWCAQRIDSELLKLGITLSQATMSRSTWSRPRWPPSQA